MPFALLGEARADSLGAKGPVTMNSSHKLNSRTRPPVWRALVQDIHESRSGARIVGRVLESAQRSLRHRASDLATWWQKQPWPTRLYSAGGIVIIASVACMLIGFTYRELPQILFIEGTVLLAAGILLEGYQIARWVMATVPGKFVAALIATMIGALSMGISSAIVNETTGFSPGDFPYTVAFLAPFTAGYIILFSILAMFVVALVAIVGFGMFSILKALCADANKVEGESAKMFARLMAATTLLVLTLHVWNEKHTSYESGLTTTASWFAYTFEMYGKDPCARSKHERVRRIEPGQALIGSERDGRRAFFVRRCTPSIFP